MNKINAIRTLLDYYAHLVLLRENKFPLWKGWNTRKPRNAEMIAEHKSGLALVSFSLGLTVIDVDEGDPDQFIRDYKPLLQVPSKSQNKWHLYYVDQYGQKNMTFDLTEQYGIKGDIRSRSGYIGLWHDSLMQLSEIMRHLPKNLQEYRFPEELFTERMVPIKITRSSLARSASVRVDIDFKQVKPGQRNVTLFDQISKEGYRTWGQYQDGPQEQWVEALYQFGLTLNAQMNDPVKNPEVWDISKKIPKWIHAHFTKSKHTKRMNDEQFKSLQSARVSRRYKARNLKGYQLTSKIKVVQDAQIFSLYIEGTKQKDLALTYNLTQSRISKIIATERLKQGVQVQVLNSLYYNNPATTSI